ncbi:MAG: acyl-CoA dehydrogenase family protein [Parasphingorhabdus sp.]|uniref:acyl-CoA dehydrogenase family protein n=1 Tax=Parasphingorhabdus sp. TaxID=2709688 RepID=UPI00329806E1
MMINIDGMIAETAAKIFTDLCGRDVPHQAEAGQYPQNLWDALQDNGLPLAWVSEENGGFGASYDEVLGAIWVSAQAASPVPFVETLIANWLLDHSGMAMAEGAASFALVQNDSAAISFFGAADHIIAYTAEKNTIALYRAADLAPNDIQSLSPDGEQQIDFSAAKPLESQSTNLSQRAVEALILTVRAVQMAAAMEAALNLSIGYVSDREQFGRPLSKFQAIQHQLSVAASESAAATMAATQAASVLAKNIENPERAWHEAVVAKVQIGHSVEAVTVPFHQVHGAMGYTQEYDLHHFTRRLWAWRDSLGNEHHWGRLLGAELAVTSPDQVWKGVTTGAWVAS